MTAPQFLDFRSIQIVAADSQFPNPRLEFLHGFSTHLRRGTRHVETEEGEPASERRDVSFLGAERQAELFDEQFDRLPCLFRLALCPAEHVEIVGVSHETIAEFVEMPVEEVQRNMERPGRKPKESS